METARRILLSQCSKLYEEYNSALGNHSALSAKSLRAYIGRFALQYTQIRSFSEPHSRRLIFQLITVPRSRNSPLLSAEGHLSISEASIPDLIGDSEIIPLDIASPHTGRRLFSIHIHNEFLEA